mgnify:CR=1 FL=1
MKFANSTTFHYVCIFTMYGAQSRFTTFSILVLLIVLGFAANVFLDDGLLLSVVMNTLTMMFGIRSVIFCLSDIRKYICTKMGWKTS